MKKVITWSKLFATCWCEFGSSRIETNEDCGTLDRSGTSSSGEGRSVIVFGGLAFCCREL